MINNRNQEQVDQTDADIKQKESIIKTDKTILAVKKGKLESLKKESFDLERKIIETHNFYLTTQNANVRRNLLLDENELQKNIWK